jgi:hypothetical protein
MYADRKEMPLEGIKVTLNLTRDDEKNITNIGRDIELLGGLTPEERDRLISIANKCPVHKLLTNPINIETRLMWVRDNSPPSAAVALQTISPSATARIGRWSLWQISLYS